MEENEQKCIDFVLRRLESQFSQVRTEVRCPEENLNTPTDMRIDIVSTIGAEKFAIEHTMIEPYEEHHKQGIATNEAAMNLKADLKDLDLKVGIDVALPSNWSEKFPKKKKRRIFIKKLANLVIEHKVTLESLPDDEMFVSLGEIDGITIRVVRNSFEIYDPSDTCPYLLSLAPDNYSLLRSDRIKRSLNDKLPKLCKWQGGHRTVLILENRDLSLTNWHSVRREIEKIWVNEAAPPINYLYLIYTTTNKWRLFPFVENGKWTSLKPNGLVQMEQFNRADLSLVF